MKVIGPAIQHYGFIESQRQTEQAQIRHSQNLKRLEKMNEETIAAADMRRAKLVREEYRYDRVRQLKEAYLYPEEQKVGHNIAMSHVDVKV